MRTAGPGRRGIAGDSEGRFGALGLFGKARKLVRGFTPPEPSGPQYDRVACPEGHVLRGLRNEGYQALRCPTCGEGVFVLPRSPLPEPPAVAPSPRPRRAVAQSPVQEDGPIPLTEAPVQL